MKISNMSADVRSLVERLHLNQPKKCFWNCMMIVVNSIRYDEMEVSYVLCDVILNDGQRFEHAIVKSGDSYFDPTLESQGRHTDCEYRIHVTLSLKDIALLMARQFNQQQIENMFLGKEEFWSLVKTGADRYEFVEC